MHGNTKHGACAGRKTPEYVAWVNMRKRCSDAAGADFVNYKARGISVDPAWNTFEVFLADMGPRPSPKHTVERIDNDGNYTKSNCVWATRDVQNNNQRIRKDSSLGVRGIRRDAQAYFVVQGSWRGVKQHLYYGRDFLEACCRRKSWENSRSTS